MASSFLPTSTLNLPISCLNHQDISSDTHLFQGDVRTPTAVLGITNPHMSADSGGQGLLDGPSPLGLTLRKTPSLIDLISARLSGNHEDQSNQIHIDAPLVDLPMGTHCTTRKLKASSISCQHVTIGYWEKSRISEGDVVTKIYYGKRKLVWEILECGWKHKMEIQWADISGLRFSCMNHASWDLLEVEVSRPPLFFREQKSRSQRGTMWQASVDFTNGQATVCSKHILFFSRGALRIPLQKLLQSDPRLKSLVEEDLQGSDLMGCLPPILFSDSHQMNSFSVSPVSTEGCLHSAQDKCWSCISTSGSDGNLLAKYASFSDYQWCPENSTRPMSCTETPITMSYGSDFHSEPMKVEPNHSTTSTSYWTPYYPYQQAAIPEYTVGMSASARAEICPWDSGTFVPDLWRIGDSRSFMLDSPESISADQCQPRQGNYLNEASEFGCKSRQGESPTTIHCSPPFTVPHSDGRWSTEGSFVADSFMPKYSTSTDGLSSTNASHVTGLYFNRDEMDCRENDKLYTMSHAPSF